MHAIKAIYDGNTFKLKQQIPVTGEYEVVITFMEPLKQSQKKMFDYCNIFDKDDVSCIAEIVKERKSFSSGRPQI
jgi:hypothetical protein